MTVRDAARRWMMEHCKGEHVGDMRSSRFYPDRGLWFFTFPSSFMDADRPGYVNLLLQNTSSPVAFHLLRVPYAFFFDNKSRFDLRADGDKFDLHLSAKRTSWLVDERSKGVAFAAFQQ